MDNTCICCVAVIPEGRMVRLAVSSVTAISASATRYHWSRAWQEHGMWDCEFTSGSASAYTATLNKMAGQNEVMNDLNITRIDIQAITSGVPLPAGTNIKIYGVRA